MPAIATFRDALRSSSKRGLRGNPFVVHAAYSDKPGRLGHLLPKKSGQRKSAASNPQPCVEDHPAPVSQEQLALAAKLLSNNEEAYDSDGELSIISSLDLDDVLHEADRLQWELSCPADLDTLRQYGPLLVARADEHDDGLDGNA